MQTWQLVDESWRAHSLANLIQFTANSEILRCLAFYTREHAVAGYAYLFDPAGFGIGEQSEAAENDLVAISGSLCGNRLTELVRSEVVAEIDQIVQAKPG